MIRPLICSPSPRDIWEVQSEMAKIKCDKIFAKYYEEAEAYKKLRDYFLDHKEYTHMVIAPDDLVITPEAFQMLLEDTKELNLPVLSGICNFTWHAMDIYPCYQSFQLSDNELRNFMTDADFYRLAGNIIQVVFEGFACCWIRRDIAEKIEIDGVEGLDGKKRAFDFGFAKNCAINDVPIYVDKCVNMLHLAQRLGDSMLEDWGRGIYPPQMRFEKS